MRDHAADAVVFKALSDSNRLQILEQLREGEKCACALLDFLHIKQSTLSYHMKILCASGLVVGRPDGKWTHYRLSPEGADYAYQLLRELTTCNTQTSDQLCSGFATEPSLE